MIIHTTVFSKQKTYYLWMMMIQDKGNFQEKNPNFGKLITFVIANSFPKIFQELILIRYFNTVDSEICNSSEDSHRQYYQNGP